MKLSEKQRLFSKLINLELMPYIYGMGYETTDGDAYRDPRVHGQYGFKTSYSSSMSLHKLRLARDINLWLDGKYLTETEQYREIGEFWESLHELCEWGGSDNRDDGNHFSFSHDDRW